MKPWVHLDTALVPGSDGQFRLLRRDQEFSIMVGSNTLMNSRMSGSEIALAQLACDRLRGRKNCRVLIGGYGMGFTLRAALAGLGAGARIIVAELVPAVLTWARGPMAELTGGCLSDPRVSIREGDVRDVIAAERASFDAILLDVDNGPDGLSCTTCGAWRPRARPFVRKACWQSGRRHRMPSLPAGLAGRGLPWTRSRRAPTRAAVCVISSGRP